MMGVTVETSVLVRNNGPRPNSPGINFDNIDGRSVCVSIGLFRMFRNHCTHKQNVSKIVVCMCTRTRVCVIGYSGNNVCY